MVDTSDLLPQTPRYLKVPLIILNAILWVLGLLLIIFGGVAVSKFSNIKDMISIGLPAGIVVIGVLFIILTVLGCFVAYKEKLVGLVFYTVFMLILLVCLIGVGGGAISYRKEIEVPLFKAWNISAEKSPEVVATVEDYLECCGWNPEYPFDSNTEKVKFGNSKCYYLNPANETVRNETTYGGKFCKDASVDFARKYLYIAGAAGLAIGIIEFISMLFALFLIIRICKSPRAKSYD
eukprot:gene11226-13752_t